MGSIRYRPRNSALPMVFEQAFDELRDAFYDRLDEERLQLLSLGAALVDAEGGDSRVLDDLVLRAHRLQGRAQIFEVGAVAEAANALEQAAFRALASGAAHGDTSVKSALAALVRLISTLDATSAQHPDPDMAG